jgi:hypothetical protein
VAGSLIIEGRLSRRGLKLLRRVLKSTLQAPYSELILIEHNGDGSVYYFVKEWAREYRVEVDRVESRGPAASAVRALLARFLADYTQEWLLLVRGLLELRPGWWVEASMHAADDGTGLVWGVVWSRWEVESGCPEDDACLEGRVRKFECLGGLDDALIRREAVRELRIPVNVKYYVDTWVYWWLKCRGWRATVVKRGAVALEDRPAVQPGEAVYEAYKLGVLEECSAPAREAYRSVLKPATLFITGLAAYSLTLLAYVLGIRSFLNYDSPRNSSSSARLKLFLARLRYGPIRHPCEVVLGSFKKS